LAGQDTIPPARLAARDVTASSVDRGANSITVTVSRIPGDDLYCGTATRFDFRFARAPMVTQADFDAATAVASVPMPPPGNHDAGGLLTVSDARFAGQLVYLAVQIVDAAGNVSPLTALGSFDFESDFTLLKGRLTFVRGPGGGDDRLSLKGSLVQSLAVF